MKELVGKAGMLVRLDLQVGELKQGSNPHIGAIESVLGFTALSLTYVCVLS